MPGKAGGGAVHFVQRCGGPVFIGVGHDALDCGCGNRLIEAYDPARFIEISLQCERCGAVTTTPPLADGQAPPFTVIIAEPTAASCTFTATLSADAYIIGRTAMERLTALSSPRTPPDWAYQVTEGLLDEATAAHERVTGPRLPAVPLDAADPYAGLNANALGWSVRHLRERMRQGTWRADEGIATPIAVATLTGFLHFVATWSHHPRFAGMVAGAAARGFSAHGLAPFAAAHCVVMMGNRIRFTTQSNEEPRITSFSLAAGPTDVVPAHLDVLDRFEVPFGQPWTKTSLRAAVTDRLAACAGRINPRNHGVLLLSPGAALAGFDEALIETVREVLQSQGRRHRGLMAVAPMVLRLQQMPDPHTVRLCYGFFPVANRHYEGDAALQTG
ncbi:MAG: hypothetical protein ACJ8AI_08265 [Rhodopila sp.]